MAKGSGIFGAFFGKIANIVGYVLNGQHVMRSLGKNDNPPTEKQIICRSVFTTVNDFISPLMEFIRVGFYVKSLKTTKNFQNLAVQYNYNHALKGTYPNQYVDFSKVLVTQGDMAITTEVQVSVHERGIQFKWDAAYKGKWIRMDDQVMLVAYPESGKEVCYTTAGATRYAGEDVLLFPKRLMKKPVHLYISFISENRRKISDSHYLGEFKFLN